MAGQNIKITIAEREYVLIAETPGKEEAMRKAADSINRMVAAYQEKFPQKGITEILSFVALREGVSRIQMQNKIEMMEKECRELESELRGYLENIDD